MQIVSYSCDRCTKSIEKQDLCTINCHHGRGKFDLRDEDYEVCPDCYTAIVKWIDTYDKA